MKVEAYRSLSARERKTGPQQDFSQDVPSQAEGAFGELESTVGAKDTQIRVAKDEAVKLRREVEALKRRLPSTSLYDGATGGRCVHCSF